MTALFALLLLSSVCARAQATEISYSSEPRAAVGALSDRLRRKFHDNGNRFDPACLDGGIASREELEGAFCDASNYGFSMESESPVVVHVIYRKRLEFQPRGFYLRTQLESGVCELMYGEIPDNRAIFPWPPDLQADNRRQREEWLSAHTVMFTQVWWFTFQAFTAIAALWLQITTRRHQGRNSPAAVFALISSASGWLVYSIIALDWTRIIPADFVAYCAAAAFALCGFASVIANRAKSRSELALSVAVLLLVLPPLVILLLGISQPINNWQALALIGVVPAIAVGVQLIRYRSARP